jgi:diaminohydroxyphosphoribosylaminopyrimidine deaminase/5-amino-6-(5-phosphoribosylamino)uracil reductase
MHASLAADRRYMRRALSLAGRGWGRAHPNPLVGALVVRDGIVLGEGYHAEFGGDHAEVAALRAAGPLARGATLFTTLEPCRHRGKTPPCTAAIQAAGVARVVYGAEDPHEIARGGGQVLEQAGLAVTGGVEREAVRRQNAAYFFALEQGRTYVALKYGLTLDARLAASAGQSTVVTGPGALAEVHRLRAGFDAILIGSTTAQVDDPLLTARGGTRPRVPPVRVVIDTEGRLSAQSRLARTAGETPVWVFCAEDAAARTKDALGPAGVRVIGVPRSPGGLDLGAALARAWDDGLRAILCEGGGRIGSALLAGGHVQRMYLFYAPSLFGSAGVEAFPALRGEGSRGAAAASHWSLVQSRRLGNDTLLVLDPRTS